LKCLFRHLPKIALLAFNAFCLGTADVLHCVYCQD